VISERAKANTSHSHHNTPKKARVRAMVDTIRKSKFFNANITNMAIFQDSGISESASYRILALGTLSLAPFLIKISQTRRKPDER
jgi:hypothetical protein